MTRVALLTAEPIRRRMAGIGIRYLELARRLPDFGLDVVLFTTGPPEEVPREGLVSAVDVRPFERGQLARLLADCDVAVTQGQVANDLLIEVPDLPTAVDFYDPFLVENFHYLDTLGLDPYRNDHATWVLQLSRGDFFLCSCEEQRQYYLGFLTAVGRVNPHLVRDDPDLRSLIAVVPFGMSLEFGEPCPLLPERGVGEKRLLFGGLYDWYDPWPVLEALERLDRPEWSLWLVRNPNPDGTPQKLFEEVRRWAEKRGFWETRLRTIDWVPADRRYDLLRDADLLVATHRSSLETRLSLRTRFLDALAIGRPVVTTEGGAISRMLKESGAGWVVPERDPDAVAAAFQEILEGDPGLVEARCQAGRQLAEAFAWDKVLEPLVTFCREPRQESTKTEFAASLATAAPRDGLLFRLRRRWRRFLQDRG